MKPQLGVRSTPKSEYDLFDQIDGTHSFRAAVPNGYVDYRVRTRHGGSVFFFNFALAREMGLISADHPDELTSALREKILETFALVIINEYDIMNEVPIRAKDIRPNPYMATRYLQLQHPSKQGKTSGDGRGIWNGEFKREGATWDVSSSGTGATRLSPAHAQTQKFFKTGDTKVGYGNGYNSVTEGLSAALLSDIFHQNGIETEQTLAIISFEAGTSINVRASKNLLRPAHFFHQLKQGNLAELQSSIDYFMNRQIANGDWNLPRSSFTGKARYAQMAEQIALTFSKIAAQFEAEYIFCWLDWDGDNILANGGIIDYGSIRQFGLYHWEYRYDDVDRMSTNIPEQRIKARYIVQNFAQIRDFILTGKKKNLRRFRNDPLLKLFDRNFKKVLHQFMLKKMGLSEKQTQFVMEKSPYLVQKLKKSHSYFEKAKSSRGIYPIADGVTCDAIFCMRDLHRELPKVFLSAPVPVDAKKFISLMKSSYAKPRDLKLTFYRNSEVKKFQQYYLRVIKEVSNQFHKGNLEKTFLEVIMRASVANHQDRITGDGVLHVTTSLIRNQKRLSFEQKQKIIECLVKHQVDPQAPVEETDPESEKILQRNLKAIQSYREGF